jgi:transcriptional repressor of cell division inhibition gene dicB
MTYDQAMKHFGTQVLFAEALGIKQPTISGWNRVIPEAYQYQIEIITGGKLKVDTVLRRPRGNGMSVRP